ncbi:MAG: hypothetical protein RL291_1004 [Pseudomonadota bacterium]
MMRVRGFFATSVAGFGLAIASAGAAHAVCLRIVGVPQGDVLNLRAGPNAGAEIVRAINPASPGVLILKRPCGPQAQPKGQQWCQIRSISGTRLRDGFVNARYVEITKCP